MMHLIDNKVRLSEHDLNALIRIFRKNFLANDRLWIFGSRTNLQRKGGDIDLYIETYADVEKAIKMESEFIWNLEQEIGEQKIDVVLNLINQQKMLPIYQVALTEGIRIV